MKLHSILSVAILCLTAFAADVAKGEFGAAAESPKTSEKPKRNTYPFSGELESHNAQSISLKGKKKSRVLLLTPETRVVRSGSRVPLSSAAAGERVSGSARKNAEGKEEALTINLKGQSSVP